MKDFKKSLFIDLTIALIVVLALAGGLIFFSSNISQSVATIVGLRQDIINRSATLNLLASLRSQYSGQGQAYLNVLHNIVPAKDRLIDLSKDFESLAKQQNLGFGFSFAGENAPTPNTLGAVAFKVNVQGTNFNQLFQFAQQLQNFHYLISLDSFNLNRQSNGMQMVIAGRAFYR